MFLKLINVEYNEYNESGLLVIVVHIGYSGCKIGTYVRFTWLFVHRSRIDYLGRSMEERVQELLRTSWPSREVHIPCGSSLGCP